MPVKHTYTRIHARAHTHTHTFLNSEKNLVLGLPTFIVDECIVDECSFLLRVVLVLLVR